MLPRSPSETKLSHRWRRRARQTSRTVSWNQMWTPERPAVGSSDWLGLFMSAHELSTNCSECYQIHFSANPALPVSPVTDQYRVIFE